MADSQEILPQENEPGDMMIADLERRQSNERDLLIALIGKYNNLKENFTNQIGEIKQNFKDEMAEKERTLNDHDNRIQSLETLRDTTNVPELIKTEQTDHQWIEAYRISWKAYLTLAVITGGVIGYILANVLKVKSLFGL